MTSTYMTSPQNAVEGLPKQFVTSLRVLFDILDEDRTGYVRLRDIESRWHEEGVKGLPSGVIDALRKVAPRNGKLSFDNFVTGLKLSLLKNNGSANSGVHSQQGKETGSQHSSAVKKASEPLSHSQPQSRAVKKVEPSSGNYANMANYMNIERASSSTDQKGNFPVQRSQPKMGSQVVNSVNTATVRPNNVLKSQNIELRNQIYTRDQIQQVKLHSRAEYQNQGELERNSNNRVVGRNPRHSDDLTHYKKNDHNRTANSQNQRPKSAHIKGHRPQMDSGYATRSNDIPAGRPERPPPYRKPENREEIPPALPPKNLQGRIMKELKTWQMEHKTGPHAKLHSTHSDSKLAESSRLPTTDLYGK